MTKLIYVTGESDYSAMRFDQSGITVEEAYKAAQGNCGEYQFEIDGDDVYVKSYEFGEVDPDFIDFITSNIVDYDQSKAADFYIVEEDE